MASILVVDDMTICRELMQATLRAEGFEVLAASNGAQACEVMSKHLPDLVLLDLSMPVMDGITMLKRIRESAATKRLPVIVLSAGGDKSLVVQAAKLGVSGYILKSQFSLKALLEAVRRALSLVPIGSASTQSESHSQLGGATESSLSSPKPQSPNVAGVALASIVPQSHHLSTPKPETVADLKSLRPLTTRSELLERINTKEELTGFSPTVSQVLNITSNQNCSMDQVAKAVSQDHAVALKVMRLANSSVYSRGDRVDSVHKAVLRIGMNSIRQAVLNIGVVERFGSIAFQHHLSTPLFWEHSIACGIIAAELAHSLKHREPDIAFTAGLLHDLGRVIYAERLGEQYVNVIETAQAMQLPLEQVESRLLVMNHAEVMDKILHAWKFPKDLVNPIVHHHLPPGDVKSAAPHQVADTLRLSLANRLAHAMLLGSSGNDTIYPTEEHCRILGVGPATIRRIEEVAKQQTDDTKFALLSHATEAAWPRRVEHYRTALMIKPFRPLYVSETPEVDAYRIFCDELAGGKCDELPNVAVVHITAARERSSVSERLTSAERKLGVPALPTLILSPNDRIGLDDAVLATRRCLALPSPTLVSQFIAAVNELTTASEMRAAA